MVQVPLFNLYFQSIGDFAHHGLVEAVVVGIGAGIVTWQSVEVLSEVDSGRFRGGN